MSRAKIFNMDEDKIRAEAHRLMDGLCYLYGAAEEAESHYGIELDHIKTKINELVGPFKAKGKN